MKSFKDILEATTLHSRRIGVTNDAMANLLSEMDSDINKIEEAGFLKSAKLLQKQVNKIDKNWDKLWDDIVRLSREITKIS